MRCQPLKPPNVSSNPGRNKIPKPFTVVPPHNTANGYLWSTRVTHASVPGKNRAAKRRYLKFIRRNGVNRKGES